MGYCVQSGFNDIAESISRVLRRRPMRGLFFLMVIASLITISSDNLASTHSQTEEALSQSYRISLAGDAIAAGVGLRGSGAGEIVLAGLPANASVVKAYLYWGTLGTSGAYNSILLNNEVVSGELIGDSANTCWSTEGNFILRNYVFRADVTSHVEGNGAYLIEGLPDDLETGNDSQGASLVVTYTVAGYPLRTIIINDGAVTLDLVKNSYTDTIFGFIADEPLTLARVTYIIGDGQPEWSTGAVTFNGVSIANNVIHGGDGEYWDTLNFDVTAYSPTSPSTTTINNDDLSDPGSPDCIVWAATIFSATSVGVVPDNSLARSHSFSLHGAATATGVGLRGTGEGEITIDSVPAGARIRQAFLYWGTIGTTGTYHSLEFNGQSLTGELIGTSENTCWNIPHPGLSFYNFVYRADVTSLVTGNGVYAISGLPKALEDGNDSQGASLVIVYTTPTDGLFRTVQIYDGAVTLDFANNSHTLTMDDFDLSDSLLDAKITYLVGDGQTEWTSGDLVFNGETLATNVFSGEDGPHWDTHSFDVSTYVSGSPATTTINNSDGPGPDCLLWAGAVFAVSSPQPVYRFQYFFPMVIK